jgi:acyl-CoA reductase-like NAD-dependent aldehyde dehydrogenase
LTLTFLLHSQANGQNCIGIERFIVHRSIYQDFIDTMQPRVAALRCGPSLSSAPGEKDGLIPTVDCGSMISSRLFEQLEATLSSAVERGAKILAGGKRLDHPVWKSGHYFQPTLIVDVNADMDIARNELFAPVMTVMPYDTIEEAVAIANSTRYGLGSAVFGNDRTECRQVAAALKTGMVAINEYVAECCVYPYSTLISHNF